MPSISLDARDLKSLLKVFNDFATRNLRKNTTAITICKNPDLQMVMASDYAFIKAPLKNVDADVKDFCEYNFIPEVLLGMNITGKKVKLSWQTSESPLQVEDGKIKASLKVATAKPDMPILNLSEMSSVSISSQIWASLTSALDLPFAYYSAKSDLAPVRIWANADGLIEASADDSFSIGHVKTDVSSKMAFDVKIPRFILTSLYGSVDSKNKSLWRIGAKDSSVILENDLVQVFFSGLNDEVADFYDILDNEKSWTTSCKFSPPAWVNCIKPLLSLIPNKDKSGSYINMEVNGKISLSLIHKDIGEAVVDATGGVEDIYNENQSPRVLVRMHPKAFFEYTNMLKMEQCKLMASSKTVLYDGVIKTKGAHDSLNDLHIKYLFPTVQV